MQVNGNIVAFILAAGFSSRMETFKPLLPLDGSLMIEKTIACFLQAGLNDIRVVIGYRAGELIPVLICLGVFPIVNEDYPSGMYSSIQAGVRTLKKEDVTFFLLPGDIPLIRPETLAEMILVFGHAWGYPRVAAIVASHMDIVLEDNGSLGEREILYLADKLIEGVRYIPLEQRLRMCMERFNGDEDVAWIIKRRFRHASLIKTHIENVLGTPVEAIWSREGAEGLNGCKTLSST